MMAALLLALNDDLEEGILLLLLLLHDEVVSECKYCGWNQQIPTYVQNSVLKEGDCWAIPLNNILTNIKNVTVSAIVIYIYTALGS